MADCANCKGDRVQLGACLDCGLQVQETTQRPAAPETTEAPRPKRNTAARRN